MMKKTRAWWGLLAWLAGILFPLAWLGNFSSAYRQVFNRLFGPAWMHWLMHAGLYAGLVLLGLIATRWPVTQKTAWLMAGLVIGVGTGQEILQSLASGAWSLPASAFDLGVDLAGGSLGWALLWGLKLNRGPGVDI